MRRRKIKLLCLLKYSQFTGFVLCIVCTYLFANSHASPVRTKRQEEQALKYLKKYGYLEYELKQSSNLTSEKILTKALMEFQSFSNLNVTGELDDVTLQIMSLPRCGLPDKVSNEYVVAGSPWPHKNLTYRVSKYSNHLDRSKTDRALTQAFSYWSDVTPLTFTRQSRASLKPVDIDIRFETGAHWPCMHPFDGPSQILAHATFPQDGGDIHFDDSEYWTVESKEGTSFLSTAAHEIGHSLGLEHSQFKEALMYASYTEYDKKLHSDDIEGIQSLYGKKPTPDPGVDDDDEEDHTESSSEKPTSTSKPTKRPTKKPTKPPTTHQPPTTPEGDPELCNDGTIDTIFNSAEGITYVFKDAHYWKLTDDGIAPDYPKQISKSWIGLPNYIDAAFTYKNGKTYFFKGSKYWRYVGMEMDGNYPKEINEGWPGIPDSVQAAMVWSGNGKIYFFKGKKFWRFDPERKPPVNETYPKLIKIWEGIPDNIDEAFQYTNGYTYFFKDGQYWRFNDRTFAVDTADPPFPRNVGYWWFGCRPETRISLKADDKRDPEWSIYSFISSIFS